MWSEVGVVGGGHNRVGFGVAGLSCVASDSQGGAGRWVGRALGFRRATEQFSLLSALRLISGRPVQLPLIGCLRAVKPCRGHWAFCLPDPCVCVMRGAFQWPYPATVSRARRKPQTSGFRGVAGRTRYVWAGVVPRLGYGVCPSARGYLFRGTTQRAAAISGIGVSLPLGFIAKFRLFVRWRRCLHRAVWPNMALKWDAPTVGAIEHRFFTALRLHRASRTARPLALRWAVVSQVVMFGLF